jgi:hypothetical protein
LPTIRVVQVPKFGTLTVRRGILSTDAIAGCAGLKIPTQVVFYELRTGHLGSDHVAYQVTAYSGGVVGIFDMTFDVKEPPKDGGPANEPKN